MPPADEKGDVHERNERKTWTVIAICTAMMIAEIIGGAYVRLGALVADGPKLLARVRTIRLHRTTDKRLR